MGFVKMQISVVPVSLIQRIKEQSLEFAFLTNSQVMLGPPSYTGVRGRGGAGHPVRTTG